MLIVTFNLPSFLPSFSPSIRHSIVMQVGLWKYRCKEREDGRQFYRPRTSCFRIMAKKVPLYQDDMCHDDHPYEPNEMLDGQFLYFAQVETPWDVGQDR